MVCRGPRILLLTLATLSCFEFCFISSAQQLNSSTSPITRLRWTRQPGITKYRIQIAADPQFSDIVFDGLVNGDEFVSRDLAPGQYYWRVAPATGETGKFLRPLPLVVKCNTLGNNPPDEERTAVNATSLRARGGWQATTGEIVGLMPARLRSGSNGDLLGVGSNGVVYALDGTSGVTLWIARFSPNRDEARIKALKPFLPLVIDAGNSAPKVVVAFAEGVRAIEGSSGRELWRTSLAVSPASGLVGGARIYLIDDKLEKLLILDAKQGTIQKQQKLKHTAIGPLVLLPGGKVAIISTHRMLAVHTAEGAHARSVDVGSEITTPPVVVATPRGMLVLLGTRKGLAAFAVVDFQRQGLIALDDDYPVGLPAVGDLDGDGNAELVMITNRGRTLAVDVADGKIRWSSDIGNTATAPVLADVNGDARLDVLLPGQQTFAVALSGIDGSEVWNSAEEGKVTAKVANRAQAPKSFQSLITIRPGPGRLVVIGNDRSLTGLRALEVSTVSQKANVH